MEPIFFIPVYKKVIWGGNNISKVLKRNIEENCIGESWEISAHPNGLSIISNGEQKNSSLSELFNDKSNRLNIFGIHCKDLEKFPILTKFIDASENLSIQVHPNNEYARRVENDSGKNEVWYIMDCKKDAKIVYGFKENVTKENLEEAIDDIEKNVKYVNIHKGDFISIPAGTIHAILGGIMLCEVQQSSDITYRVYDWNRIDKDGKPRELHKQKALDVINLDNQDKIYNYANIQTNTNVYKSDIFSIDIMKIEGTVEAKSNEESFYAYIILEGNGSIETENFSRTIEKGSTFLIPATLGNYKISGNLKLMKIWV